MTNLDTSRTLRRFIPVAALAGGALIGLALLLTLGNNAGSVDNVEIGDGTETAASAATSGTDESVETNDRAGTGERAATGDIGGRDNNADIATSESMTTTTTTNAAASPSSIDADEAGRLAATHVGGTVDTINPETEYGAAWDVDVYAPDGEYTVYVDSIGQIVRVDGPFND